MTFSWKSARTPFFSAPFSKDLITPARRGAVLPSLRREEEEHTVMLGSLGALYTLGYPVDWNRIYPAGGRCVRLPFYPWQRERCWLEARGRRTPTLTRSRSLDERDTGSIRSWAGISNRRILRKPTSGKSHWTRVPCLIWMTIASKASRCCPASAICRDGVGCRSRGFRVTIICAEGRRISPGACFCPTAQPTRFR